MNYKHEIEQLMSRVQRLEHLVNELWSAETGDLPEADASTKKNRGMAKHNGRPKQLTLKRRSTSRSKPPKATAKRRTK